MGQKVKIPPVHIATEIELASLKHILLLSHYYRVGISHSVQPLAAGWRVRISNQCFGKRFFFSLERSYMAWAPLTLLFNGYFSGGKEVGV
jgi:hypothetical protein